VRGILGDKKRERVAEREKNKAKFAEIMKFNIEADFKQVNKMLDRMKDRAEYRKSHTNTSAE